MPCKDREKKIIQDREYRARLMADPVRHKKHNASKRIRDSRYDKSEKGRARHKRYYWNHRCFTDEDMYRIILRGYNNV